MDMQQNLLKSVIQQFEYYKMLGERTFEQLNEEQILRSPQPESNSIAIIVNHLHGNMKSRWTDFLTTDGEKPWRNRDQEFEDLIRDRQQLRQKWDQGWKALLDSLNDLTPDDVNREVLISNQKHKVYEAINRQLAHYAYHVGQIVFLGKMIKGTEWQSLSIPKGQSQDFNKEKFDKGIHGGHFTQEFMDEDSDPPV